MMRRFLNALSHYARSYLVCLVLVLASLNVEAQRYAFRFTPVVACSGTSITTSDTWDTIVSAGAAGATFCIQSGTHRLQSITPKDNQRFIGVGWPVMSGARLLTSPGGSGPWTYTGQTQAGTDPATSTCSTVAPECAHPEDVFIDDVVQTHVGTLGAVTTGTWFFNYATDTIYIGTNPSGHVVETSVTTAAILNEAVTVTGVKISGLIIEKYANPGNFGAISAPNSNNWVVSDNIVRLNHATGIVVGSKSTVRNNYSHHNGLTGIGGYNAIDVTWERNELSFNGRLFDAYWGAAGMKVAYQRDGAIRNNNVHDNYGGGIWCDIDCDNIIIANNTVPTNEQFGIQYEISWNGSIHDNVITGNGYNDPGFGPAQAGIFIHASKGVDIYNNTVSGNVWGIIGWMSARGTSPYMGIDWSLENLTVHNNTVCVTAGGAEANLAVSGFTDTTYYTSKGNSFTLNTYKGTSTGNFYWMDATRTFAAWQGFSQDAAGSRSVGATCP